MPQASTENLSNSALVVGSPMVPNLLQMWQGNFPQRCLSNDLWNTIISIQAMHDIDSANQLNRSNGSLLAKGAIYGNHARYWNWLAAVV